MQARERVLSERDYSMYSSDIASFLVNTAGVKNKDIAKAVKEYFYHGYTRDNSIIVWVPVGFIETYYIKGAKRVVDRSYKGDWFKFINGTSAVLMLSDMLSKIGIKLNINFEGGAPKISKHEILEKGIRALEMLYPTEAERVKKLAETDKDEAVNRILYLLLGKKETARRLATLIAEDVLKPLKEHLPCKLDIRGEHSSGELIIRIGEMFKSEGKSFKYPADVIKVAPAIEIIIAPGPEEPGLTHEVVRLAIEELRDMVRQTGLEPSKLAEWLSQKDCQRIMEELKTRL